MSHNKLKTISGGVSGPVVVAIMDGVGIGRGDEADAVAAAKTPNLDALRELELSTSLKAHGTAVGMPSDKDMGNSEVGHNALGAGRVFDQGAKLVRNAIASGQLFEGAQWNRLVDGLRAGGGALHLVGLLSDGNVHSHIEHVKALLSQAAAVGVKEGFVHALLDGRDVPKTSALSYVDDLEAHLSSINDAHPGVRYRIASGGGRMLTTMDRYESDWTIVERGWNAHVHGQGRAFASTGEAVETFRAETPGINDQDLPAFVIHQDGTPIGPMRDGDGVITFNFRGDRMLQLCAAFEREDFAHFDRGDRPKLDMVGITLYDGDLGVPASYLVSPPSITDTLGELLCEVGVRQVACSETQKYGHVTYFWNGNRSGAFDNALETYIEIPSNPPPFDAAPEMKAAAITDAAVDMLQKGEVGLMRLNYANGDMVGHTGNIAAAVGAVEAVDHEIGRLRDAVLCRGGALVVTADHGNADDMAERDKKSGAIRRDAEGEIRVRTSHSLNPVPFHVVLGDADAERFSLAEVDDPGLANVAATVAILLGFEPPQDYLPALIKRRG